MAQGAKTPRAAQKTEETSVPSLAQKDPLEEGMATHSWQGKSHGQRSLVGYRPQESQTGFSQEITNQQHELSPIPVLSLVQF